MTLEQLRYRRQEILAIAATYGAGNVRVFGSVARGEAGPGSDVDILVRLDAGRSLLDVSGLHLDLEQLLGVPVSLMTDGAVDFWEMPKVREEALAL